MYKIGKTMSGTAFDIFNTLFMIAISFVFLAPILHVTFASLSDPVKLSSKTGIILWPLGFTLEGYKIVFSNQVILMGYANTLFYLACGVVLGVLLTFMGGYALSRRNLLWGNAIMLLLTVTMFFGGGLIPFFTLVNKLGMYDTRWAIIIPSAISVFNIILVRTSLKEIPASLEESAKIDGAGHMTIMFKVILPLSKATIAVVALFYGISIWNNWFSPSIFLRDRSKYPLQLVLKEVLVANDTSYVMKNGMDAYKTTDIFKPLVKYCAIMASTIPVLCFYPFAQKYFVKGVMIGSLKG